MKRSKDHEAQQKKKFPFKKFPLSFACDSYNAALTINS